MQKRILFCLDDLEHSKAIVSYAAQLIGAKDDVQITLLHCIKSADLDLGFNEMELSETDKVEIDKKLFEYYSEKEQEVEFNCQDVFNSAREILVQKGFNDNKIIYKLIVKDMNVAACILQEAYNDGHDTIVIGKRREVKLPITKLGAVAENVLTNAIGKTIWLVSVATSRGNSR